MTGVNKKALVGLLGLFGAMAALLFVPAWTLRYWQAWVFLSVFFGAALAITVYLMKRNPGLLERRIYAGPTARWQHIGQRLMALLRSTRPSRRGCRQS